MNKLFFILFLMAFSNLEAQSIFGYNSIGSGTLSMSANTKIAGKFTTDAKMGTVTNIAAYVNRTATGSGYAVRCGIYTDNAGVPNSLVANSSIVISTNLTKSAAAWYTGTYATAPVLSASTSYWLVIQFASASVMYLNTTGGTGVNSITDTYSDDLSASYGTTTSSTDLLSVYITFTPAATGKPRRVSLLL